MRLTVGYLPYPPGRQPERSLDHLLRPLPGELLAPQEAEVRLDGPATVRTGQTLRHGLLVRNLAGRVLPIATNGNLTAVVVEPQTGQVAGGFAGAQRLPLIMFPVAPGTTERIPLLIGTASPAWATACRLDHGGSWSRSTCSGTHTPVNSAEPRSSLSRSSPERVTSG